MIEDKPIDYKTEYNKTINKLVSLRQKHDELKEDHDYIISLADRYFDERIKLKKENEQLKQQLQNTSDQRNEFHREARENANRVGKLEKENKELKELVSEVDNELEIRDIVCGAGKFRLEEWGKHRYHQFYKGDEELEDETVVIMLMEFEKENKELKTFKDKVFALIDARIEIYKHKPFMAPVSAPMSVNFDEDTDRLARLSELEQLKEELSE